MQKNVWFLATLLSLATLILNCSSTPHFHDFIAPRTPAQTNEAPIATKRLDEFVETALNYVKSPSLTKESCVRDLSGTYLFLNSLEANYFDRSDWNKERLQKIQNNLWELNLALRQKIRDWVPYKNKYETDPLPEDCVGSLRDAFRAIRFVNEYIGFLFLDKPTETHLPNYRVKTYVTLNTHAEKQTDSVVANPELSYNFELHSGDILASRGNAVISSAIARLGVVDAQFSHLAIVYVDPKTKEPWTIEAHIESGVQISPFRDYVKDNPARVVQYRFHDGELAHKSAKYAYDTAKNVVLHTGRGIPYDFKANLEDSSAMYCSEVVRKGYDRANEALQRSEFKESRQIAVPPMFLTKVFMKNRDFLDKLQIPNGTFFAPGDMDLDSRFEVISEWRDYARAPKLWAFDTALSAIFNWMENDGYKVRPHLAIKTLGAIQDYMPWVGDDLAKLLGKPVPPVTVNGGIIKVSRTLARAGSIITKKLLAEIDKLPYKPSPKEMFDMLEKIKREDAELYRRWSLKKAIAPAPTFHKFLRPDDMTSIWMTPSPIETTRIPASQGVVEASIHKKRVEKVHLGED